MTSGSLRFQGNCGVAAALGVQPLWLSKGKGAKRYDVMVHYVEHGMPDNALKLVLTPKDKLKAAAVLPGIKLQETSFFP